MKKLLLSAIITAVIAVLAVPCSAEVRLVGDGFVLYPEHEVVFKEEYGTRSENTACRYGDLFDNCVTKPTADGACTMSCGAKIPCDGVQCFILARNPETTTCVVIKWDEMPEETTEVFRTMAGEEVIDQAFDSCQTILCQLIRAWKL